MEEEPGKWAKMLFRLDGLLAEERQGGKLIIETLHREEIRKFNMLDGAR